MLKSCTNIYKHSYPSHIHQTARKMATSAAPSLAAAAAVKKEFLVILPDQDGALERRMSVRPYV